MAYYSRIRDLREDNDISQKELAAHLHVSQRSYSHYENGDRAMPIDILERLAAYYNTSMDYLVERTDAKRPYPPGKSMKN